MELTNTCPCASSESPDIRFVSRVRVRVQSPKSKSPEECPEAVSGSVFEKSGDVFSVRSHYKTLRPMYGVQKVQQSESMSVARAYRRHKSHRYTCLSS